MQAYLGGVLVDHATVHEENNDAEAAMVARSGFLTVGGGLTLGKRTLRVTLRFEGAYHDHRARAAKNLLQMAAPLALEAVGAGDTIWGSARAVAISPAGSVRYGFEGKYRVVQAEVLYLGGFDERPWRAAVNSVIQPNDFSYAGVTRVPLPGEAPIRAGGGAEDAAGRWVDDPSPFAGKAYAANLSIGNHESPTVVEASAADWGHHTPFLIPGIAHLANATPLSEALTVDLTTETSRWVLLYATATWGGTGPDLQAKLEARWGASGATTMSTMLAPMRTTAGAHAWMKAVWMNRAALSKYDARFTGADANLTDRTLAAYDMESMWALHSDERLSELLVGIGASQAWIRGSAIHPMNAKLSGAREPCCILLDSGALWWRVQHANRDSVRLTSNVEDELVLWANGVIELSTSVATFRVTPGDTAKALGSRSFTPHSGRVFTIGSLEDFTASAASGVATVNSPTVGQRFGFNAEANVDAMYRRTRSSWAMRS